MTKLLGPELEVICAAARTKVGDADRECLMRVVETPLDEALLLRLVDRHRIAPLLLRGLSHVDPDGLSERFRVAVLARAHANSARALRQTAELLTVVRVLEQQGIRALPMKGVALAEQVYGDLSARVVGDIDLLVEPSRALEADRILADNGYVRTGPRHRLTLRQTRTFMRERKHFHYVHADSGAHVELHWRCVNNPRLFPVKTDELLGRAEVLRIGGASLAVMSAEDLTLFLCVHGANHGWFRLIWLCDVQELLTGGVVEIDLDRTRQRARQLGLERMLLQACLLARRILGTRLPASLLEEASNDAAVTDLVEVATRALVENESRWWVSAPLGDLWRQTRYRLKLRPKLGYKLRGIRTLMFNAEDWDTVSLPDRAFPVYLLLRPLLAIKRRLVSGSGPPPGAVER